MFFEDWILLLQIIQAIYSQIEGQFADFPIYPPFLTFSHTHLPPLICVCEKCLWTVKIDKSAPITPNFNTGELPGLPIDRASCRAWVWAFWCSLFGHWGSCRRALLNHPNSHTHFQIICRDRTEAKIFGLPFGLSLWWSFVDHRGFRGCLRGRDFTDYPVKYRIFILSAHNLPIFHLKNS